MGVAYIVVAVLLSLMVIASGIFKLQRNPRVVDSIHEVIGVPLNWFPVLAALEFAGAAGLLIGIIWPPLGLAAAIGLVVYFVGAVVSHVRVGDYKGLSNPALPLFLAIATLVVRFISL